MAEKKVVTDNPLDVFDDIIAAPPNLWTIVRIQGRAEVVLHRGAIASARLVAGVWGRLYKNRDALNLLPFEVMKARKLRYVIRTASARPKTIRARELNVNALKFRAQALASLCRVCGGGGGFTPPYPS